MKRYNPSKKDDKLGEMMNNETGTKTKNADCYVCYLCYGLYKQNSDTEPLKRYKKQVKENLKSHLEPP